MGSKPVPRLELVTVPPEDSTDFLSLPWYQTLVNDPSFTSIGNRSCYDKDQASKRRTFFSQTLWTDSTIRATQTFYKGSIHPERWSGKPRPIEAQEGPGECRQPFSLGEGVGSGVQGFAHGGLMATLLDEVMGTPVYVQWAIGCVTGELAVKYERPLPIPGVVLGRAWLEKIDGRKVWIRGLLEDGNGLVFATGQSLFIKFKEKL